MDSYKVVSRTKDSGSTKSLLNKGIVPGILYGKGVGSIKIAFEEKILKKLMHQGGFYSKILNLKVDGKVEKILPKELQYHPVTDRLIHFDFLRVHDDTKVVVEVPVEFLNQDICPALKQGGVLNLVRRLIELACNASNIPAKLQFDLVNSEIGDAIKISNIELPVGVKPTIIDRDFVVATLVPPTIEVEPEPEKETKEGAEGETIEDAEGETEEEAKEKEKADDKKEEPSKENKSK